MISSLAGKRVLITRSRKQAGRFAAALQAVAAQPVLLPAFEIVEPESWDPLDHALQNLADFDWVVFTSSNAVEAVVDRMHTIGIDLGNLSVRRLAVVGTVSGETLKHLIRAADAVPATTFTAEALAKELGDVRGQTILLPRGDLAKSDLPQALSAAGANVLEVIVYRAVPLKEPAAVRQIERPDVITFTSAESARVAVNLLGEAGVADWTDEIPIACIGPVTAAAVREMGLHPSVVAKEFTTKGLIAAMESHFGA
jgi:uroporphyrinogen III methyltransferase/synthase